MTTECEGTPEPIVKKSKAIESIAIQRVHARESRCAQHLLRAVMSFEKREMFHYSCRDQDESDNTISAGISTDTNETCQLATRVRPARPTLSQRTRWHWLG
jgi:hypothetical protein